MTFASSSPPKLSFLRHGPFSSATTRRPRSVSTFAAAAPVAPAPMMQTSARSGLRLRATIGLRSGVGASAGGPIAGALAAAVYVGQRLRAGKADHLPTDPVPV